MSDGYFKCEACGKICLTTNDDLDSYCQEILDDVNWKEINKEQFLMEMDYE